MGIRRKNLNIDQDKLDRAKKVLGVDTETEAVDEALGQVLFADESAAGLAALDGTDVEAVFRKELVRPFERRRRILTPSTTSVLRAGDVLAEMRRRGTLPAGSLPGALLNDVLIATTCLENGVVLLTHNTRDFDRISRELTGFRYAPA